MGKPKNNRIDVEGGEISYHLIPIDKDKYDEIKQFWGEVSEFEKDQRKMLKDIEQAVSTFKGKYGIKELQVYCVNMAGMDVWMTNPITPPRKRTRKSNRQGKKTVPDY